VKAVYFYKIVIFLKKCAINQSAHHALNFGPFTLGYFGASCAEYTPICGLNQITSANPIYLLQVLKEEIETFNI
jgi:hypothetical protein